MFIYFQVVEVSLERDKALVNVTPKIVSPEKSLGNVTIKYSTPKKKKVDNNPENAKKMKLLYSVTTNSNDETQVKQNEDSSQSIRKMNVLQSNSSSAEIFSFLTNVKKETKSSNEHQKSTISLNEVEKSEETTLSNELNSSMKVSSFKTSPPKTSKLQINSVSLPSKVSNQNTVLKNTAHFTMPANIVGKTTVTNIVSTTKSNTMPATPTTTATNIQRPKLIPVLPGTPIPPNCVRCVDNKDNVYHIEKKYLKPNTAVTKPTITNVIPSTTATTVLLKPNTVIQTINSTQSQPTLARAVPNVRPLFAQVIKAVSPLKSGPQQTFITKGVVTQRATLIPQRPTIVCPTQVTPVLSSTIQPLRTLPIVPLRSTLIQTQPLSIPSQRAVVNSPTRIVLQDKRTILQNAIVRPTQIVPKKSIAQTLTTKNCAIAGKFRIKMFNKSTIDIRYLICVIYLFY